MIRALALVIAFAGLACIGVGAIGAGFALPARAWLPLLIAGAAFSFVGVLLEPTRGRVPPGHYRVRFRR